MVVTGLTGEAMRSVLAGVHPDAVLVKPVDLDQFTATCVGVCVSGRAL